MNWLKERERVDARFRCSRLAEKFVELAANCSTIVDLASGTGSNVRYLLDHGLRNKQWLLIDCDESAIADIELDQNLVQDCVTHVMDLSSQLSSLKVAPRTAVTGSAFLDLTSRAWIAQFVQHFINCPLLICMTPSTHLTWYPEHAIDERIYKIFESSWTSDRGFGPAIGFNALECLIEELTSQNRSIEVASSDWTLDPNTDRGFLTGIIDRTASRIATELSADAVAIWKDCRMQQLSNGDLRVHWKHSDLLAW